VYQLNKQDDFGWIDDRRGHEEKFGDGTKGEVGHEMTGEGEEGKERW